MNKIRYGAIICSLVFLLCSCLKLPTFQSVSPMDQYGTTWVCEEMNFSFSVSMKNYRMYGSGAVGNLFWKEDELPVFLTLVSEINHVEVFIMDPEGDVHDESISVDDIILLRATCQYSETQMTLTEIYTYNQLTGEDWEKLTFKRLESDSEITWEPFPSLNWPSSGTRW